MSKDILKHINDERDISRYKLQALKKGVKKQYKERLITLEEDFLDYPFERLNLKSVDQVRDAMLLFRSDRKAFNEEYESFGRTKSRVITSSQIKILKDKCNFYKNKYKNLLDIQIKELNIIQSEYLKSLYSGEPLSLESNGIDYILEAEGAALAKTRARIQVLTYCLARFIYNKAKSIEVKISLITDPEEYDDIRAELSNFFNTVNRDIFKHYNDGISEVPLLVNGTLGHNNFISTIYPLSNLFDKVEGNFCFRRLLSPEKAFFSDNGKFIEKKFVNRGFGLTTPLRRVGNESIALLYIDLWTSAGTRITPIIENSFFNYKIDGEYYKAVSAKPITQWPKNIDNPYLLAEILTFLGINSFGKGLNLNSVENINTINKISKSTIDIDLSLSKILTAATRSESEHIKQAANYIDSIISSIEREFCSHFTG